ncbi:MAG: DUF1700 domain-containing protein [Butyrivibrio sp.]|nr:DUF1700 domain-containing protein [Butyrivibrio sp.]
MNKEEFLRALRDRLSGLPEADMEERIIFYREMIEDRMEDGFSEEEAVAQIGPVEDIVSQIMSEIPLTRIVKERVKPRRKLKTWEIVLLILGFPLWFPLLISAFAVLLSLYITVWSVLICIYAADLSLAAGAACGIFGIFLWLRAGNPAGAVFGAGAALTCAGLAILLFFACIWLTRGLIRGTGRILTGLKTSLVGKGNDYE